MVLDKESLYVIKKILIGFYKQDSNQRVGFIRPNNYVVEVQNSSDIPQNSFIVDAETIGKEVEENQAWATWHTHPIASANLSGLDYYTFKAWPDLYHFIIGNDGIKCYKWDYDKNALLEVEYD